MKKLRLHLKKIVQSERFSSIYFNLPVLEFGNYCLKGMLGLSIVLAQIPLLTINSQSANSQSARANGNLCGSPGKDGAVNISSVVNTYFVGGAPGEIASPGERSLTLPSSNPNDANIPIAAGDMLMIIQMQDATIDPDNDATYGSGDSTNDGSGAVDIGNSGLYEFVRATNNVPASGGVLEFVGGGAGGGLQNSYVNAAPTATQGRKTFQVIRVPQFATLTLQSNLEVPDWDGTSGGILAIDVAGTINFNGFTINGTAKGFRGGYTPSGPSGPNIPDYAVIADPNINRAGGKGEGIAGTPRFTWDGTTANDLGSDRLPGGDAGRGAPGNAGGGGNDHNSGGGGGGNGGKGGTGGIGWEGAGFVAPANNTDNTPGGRGGAVPDTPSISRLIMGGGGGGGDANNEQNGVRGGQGGGIVMIRAGEYVGSGSIEVNGSDGELGEDDGAPDGAGGGGAGGTVALIAEQGSLAGITVEAEGGDGGNTVGDSGTVLPHGPGGAGAGGIIISNSPGGTVNSFTVAGGEAGRTASGNGIPHGTDSGDGGITTAAVNTDIPPILSGSQCFPTLEVSKTEANPGVPGERTVPNTANYSITVTNTSSGSAAGVKIKDTLPTGFTYAAGATGATNPDNTGTAEEPEFGEYLIPGGGSVTINFEVDIAANTPLGIYQNPAFVTYLDPSRSTPGRSISPSAGANTGDNTTYEGGNNAGQTVPGTNYIASASADENVHITSSDPVSPLNGKVVINEVMFRQTGSRQAGNDEFIELYNASDSSVDLSGWQLIDGNLLTGETDGVGSINGNQGAFVIPNQTILNSGDYLVVWVGSDTGTSNKQAPNAAYQFYAEQSPKLRDGGDDIWLYDTKTRIVDYVAYGLNRGGSTAISTPPDPSFNLWNDTYQDDLRRVDRGQSISLTPNGIDENDSACWEPTTSEDAESRCSTYLLTRDTDVVGSRVTSVGRNNNGARLVLVKRITDVTPNRSGVNFNTFIDDGISNNEDNDPKWPSDNNTYLRGQLGKLQVQPGDEIEYTVYFLSNGGRDAQDVKLCDVVPEHTTFVKNTYGTEVGIGLGLSSNSLPTTPNIELSNSPNDDRGEFYAPSSVPPAFCQKNDPNNPQNLIPVNSNNNDSGAVVVELDNALPYATDSGTPAGSYGFIRFRTKVK